MTFKVGDRVIGVGRPDNKEIDGLTGTVLALASLIVVDFGETFDGWAANGSVGPTCWGVKASSLRLVPTPPTTAAYHVGMRLRHKHDDAHGDYKAGDIVTVKGLHVDFRDRDNDTRCIGICKFDILSETELTQAETVEKLRAAIPTPKYKAGDVVTVSDASLANKTGVIVNGPDQDGDYYTAILNGDAVERAFYAPHELAAVAA